MVVHLDKKQKLLLITFDFPPVSGGIAKYLHVLSNMLFERGYDIKVLTNYAAFSREYDKQSPFKVVRVNKSKALWLFFLLYYFAKYKPNTLIIGHFFIVNAISIMFFSKFFRMKTILISHGNDINTRINVLLPLRRYLLNRFDYIVANSSYTKNRIYECSNRQDVQVIYPPVYIEKSDDLRPDASLDVMHNSKINGKIIILTICRLVKIKNITSVLHSIKDLISQGRNVLYCIVGEGPDLHDLKSEAKRIGIEDRVVFIGNVPHDLVWRYYSAADIFVQPSINIDLEQESFGMTYVEASLFNVPVIAGQSGAVNEVVINNETGIVVDGKNMNDLTRAMEKIIDNNQFRERITKNAYARAITIFSAKAQIDKMVDLIEK